jgi:hypothetical protein
MKDEDSLNVPELKSGEQPACPALHNGLACRLNIQSDQ